MISDSALLILSLVVALFTLTTVHLLSKCAPRLGLLAVPGAHRQHQISTPLVGGLSIYLSALIGILLFNAQSVSLLPSVSFICLIGALDDRYQLPSWSRFVAQGIAAYLMIHFTGVALTDLGFIFSADNRVLMTSGWSIAMTLFACIGVVNAVNMSDGLDGLAGSLALIVLIALYIIGHPMPVLIIIVASSVAGFLFWNLRVGRPSATVFLGDAGSLMLGLILAYFLIQYSQFEGGIYSVTAIWLLALPLIDAVAVLIVRPLRGRSPFSADRIHYHHQLLDRGFSVNTSLLIIISLQLLFVFIGVFFWQSGMAEHIQLKIFLSIFAFYTVRLYYFSSDFFESK